jgi:2-oxoglutarate/2-oxoacid ferredoxin oxidoreductase subunit alpha
VNYNILIGGAAGQGMDTLAAVFEKLLKRKGFQIFTVRDYMSRIRGGHNFIQVRFGTERLYSHCDELDGIIALNAETIELHIGRLKSEGFAIADEDVIYEDKRLLKLPLKKAAKDLGNARVSGSVAIGAVLRIFGIEPEGVENVFKEIFHGDAAELNISAVKKGFTLTAGKFAAVPKDKDTSILINGNEATALGVLAAGCKFYSAYPMTPSTSIMNYLAGKMTDAEIVVEQAEDEIAAVNMAIGASYAGARAMTGTSGGGFSLMVEALGLAGMMEVPLVIADVQRPGPVTGLPTRTEQSDLKFVISASHGEFPRMVIALKNPEDAFRQTIRAFELAEKYQIPVILLSDQFLADTTVTTAPFDFSKIELNGSGISPRVIPGRQEGVTVMADSDEHDEYGHITESAEVRIRQMDKRMHKLELMKKEIQEPDFMGEENCEVLLLAWGSTWGPVKAAIELLNRDGGKKYGALVFGDIWPLPVKQLKQKAENAKYLINVEQNATGQLASLVSEATGIFCNASILKYDGRAMNADYIYSRAKESEQANV